MTVIAWDGNTLAADKRSSCAGLPRKTTKIHKVRGHLVGSAGIAAYGNAMRVWFEGGADPAAYPEFQKHPDDYCEFLVITPERKITLYQRSPYPLVFEEATHAVGSGRDYAMAAMYLGLGAYRAVELASHFVTDCGDGIDTLEL